MATDSENQPHQASQPPVDVDLRVSPSTCSISGNPPFVTTISYTCTTARPIYALISLFSDFAEHIDIRDPAHYTDIDRRIRDPTNYAGKNRRIGCSITMDGHEWDSEALEREDAVLVRLAPGEKFETMYTFAVEPKDCGYRRSDVYHMKEHREYFMELKVRRCWWMFEDEMQEGLSEKEKKELLGQGDGVKWKPNCRVDFTAVR